ncbi:MAG: hypothetical protein CBC24_00340 [Candidatus Pelagibacter sp. TMED64]|nr:MAG: hypothetical protein CBC24_08065 [Candidatus Pelagibacter sp. TMED64]OUU67845.1 MAG: hypothetical protein CBC24_00340 [Candidatus Pelagibacter sp. TMED64]|tara:strand:- start:499 stop:1740 length:1242 start_codon:yes stop_codon:yes gene_type:complete
MAEETKEAVQEETVDKTEDQAQPKTKEKKEEPAPYKTPVDEDGTLKLDLRKFKQEEDASKEQSTDEVPVRDESETSGEVQEQNIETTDEKPSGESDTDNQADEVLELVNEEEEATLADKIKDIPNKLKEKSEDVNNIQEPQPELPENIDKLVDFMKETGGTLEDYVNLNKDYADMEDMQILREHYRQTKPHLTEEEISFLIDDSFSYDEESDEERDVKRKKLALKESIAEAKSTLTNLKSKYYDELKLSSKLSHEQKEAVQFYDNYKQTQETSKQQRSIFEQKTSDLFSENFKGFEYKVGENKYRFKVKDVNNVKENQSDINSLVSKFVDKNNNMKDAGGYHKALFTAMNADAVANHFYEQGKADAVKANMAQSKNIDMNPRGTHENVTTQAGMQVKAVSGDDFERLRIKLRK